MGCWGMGITQTDEYCEIYERFMEEYNEGKPLSDIKQDILDEYLEEFDENDGVLHDVYFALGKAEWMCGGISDDVLEKITHIISFGANIEFYRELETNENDLKVRQKNLEKFLKTISTPREKTKKRKTPTEKYAKVEKPKLPKFKCGDIFAYKVDEKYRVICFITRGRFCTTYASFCYAWAKLYENMPTINDLKNDYIVPLGYFTIESFPNMEKLTYIDNYPDMLNLDLTYPKILHRPWKASTFTIANEENLLQHYSLDLCAKLSDCLKKIDELKKCSISKFDM
ncbi:MAG: hypothetical protein IJA80_05820 [Clostridia bacterium]|nr:hypothetical protein [Clostridia bacterium]